ncbi:enoyl-CoA hydratase/isomerase family protein [Halodurantibacterium flavum]|uniref:3-hydroxyisobutyryl-CoA hydrolase n=1 Tax=Halodurantibacterium flavum TaxID=1382802 RepID=A0ABW4S4F1_9RHOB
MAEVAIRRQGRAGRITLNRPGALNALSHAMCLTIEAALDSWRDDDAVELVIIDAEGDRAFCAGGDIAALYHHAVMGRFEPARRYWRDEYRMNLKLRRYPKPVVSLMQGFVMGGGVGLGCHVSHRIVGESSQVAMPECGIGLVPDVGGTRLLARAPGRLGLYLGLTGARMGAGDAILAGFADHHVPEAEWPDLILALAETGDPAAIPIHPPPSGRLAGLLPELISLFSSFDVAQIIEAAASRDSRFAAEVHATLSRNSPLSMACTAEMLQRLGPAPGMAEALRQEYRFTWRAQTLSDFTEGTRAVVIDKDRTPRWRHASAADVPRAEVETMLAPLGAEEWQED